LRRLIFLSIFFCARLLSAQGQNPVPSSPTGSDPVSIAFRQMEIFERTVKDANEEQAHHTAEKRAAEEARLEFREKANKFVALWEDFVMHLNDKQTFDAKLALKLSKAFHELEMSDGWPIRAVASNSK